MINKKNLWFLTLFSLILVLSIYYITMPSELMLTTNANNNIETDTEPTIVVEESDLLVSLRVEADEAIKEELEDLQLVLTKAESSVDEKNMAYEKIKEINNNRSKEEKLEEQIKQTYNLNSFIKIKGNQIMVTVDSKDNSETIANNIMRTIQSNFEDSKYITVKFQK